MWLTPLPSDSDEQDLDSLLDDLYNDVDLMNSSYGLSKENKSDRVSKTDNLSPLQTSIDFTADPNDCLFMTGTTFTALNIRKWYLTGTLFRTSLTVCQCCHHPWVLVQSPCPRPLWASLVMMKQVRRICYIIIIIQFNKIWPASSFPWCGLNLNMFYSLLAVSDANIISVLLPPSPHMDLKLPQAEDLPLPPSKFLNDSG